MESIIGGKKEHFIAVNSHRDHSVSNVRAIKKRSGERFFIRFFVEILSEIVVV